MAKAEKNIKTNVARLLEKAGIPFQLIPYPVDENNLAADHIADVLNEDINRIFKTLVLHDDKGGHLVCVVPGNTEVDLRKAARATGHKKIEMIPQKLLQPLTGYIRGGCSPIGMKKPFPTFFHLTALNFDTIYVSAGMRGIQLKINPHDLISYTGAQIADIATNTINNSNDDNE